ncbi:hypothetical protein BAUCODRAFT_306412 [Baudoinia panamericana UAMH 10762]|uniref:Uncharacterized protein n=1 Tax=Baudoinia panamericana (strain UAMH 10762) TaxID=717646 RepID=M2MKI2_BAUPA|nr:uncharacterized protein BAUCODRAFT_306412 [Baudoinia panamericana UAMH 10762]EMC91838.1 hypothetical protein BAUCODRAFT_306412 [Baudoinia panamericana UAMH 10762]
MSAATVQPETAVQIHDAQKKASSLQRAKVAVQYLIDPKTGPQPAHLRTRTFLRSLRYLTIFIFWRLLRYARYAAVGALVAAVSGTAIGSVASGAALFIAPPGIFAGAGVGLLWAFARFGWNRAKARMRRHQHDEHADPRKDEQEDAVRSKHSSADSEPSFGSEPW